MHCEPLDPNDHDLAVISYAGQAETKVVYWVCVHDLVPPRVHSKGSQNRTEKSKRERKEASRHHSLATRIANAM